jgi:hypothetical protein
MMGSETKIHQSAGGLTIMSQLTPSIRERILRMAMGAECQPLEASEVFIKTARGRLECARPETILPRRLRMLLMLMDGKRSVADFRSGLTRYRNLDDSIDMLRHMGYIQALPQRLDI